MKKYSFFYLTIVAFFFGANVKTFGQEQQVIFVTSKAEGDSVKILVNSGIELSIAWGNDQFVSYQSAGTFIGDKLKGGKKVTIKATGLDLLHVDNNGITELDLSEAALLQQLYCNNNELSTLNTSKQTALAKLSCADNQLAEIDISNNRKLKELNCAGNKIEALNVSFHPQLTSLICADNKISSLNLAFNSKLTTLWCQGNLLEELSASRQSALTSLLCYDNQLTKLTPNVTAKLVDVWCDNNQLAFLNIRNSSTLETFSCSNNLLDSMFLPAAARPKAVYCENNALRFSSLFYYQYVKEYVYAPQRPVKLLNDGEINMNEVLDLTKEGLSASGTNTSPFFDWYDGEGNLLNMGVDYTQTQRQFTFLHPIQGVYFEATSNYMNDYVMKSEPFNVMFYESVQMEELKGATFITKDGCIVAEVVEPIHLTIYSIQGQAAWSGTLEAGSHTIALPKGSYVIGDSIYIL